MIAVAPDTDLIFEPDAVVAEFEQLATDAERDLNILRGQPHDSEAGLRYDEMLACTSVYGYLRGRHFLDSMEQLANELQWLLEKGRPVAPVSARSAIAFNSFRDVLLTGLISRFGG